MTRLFMDACQDNAVMRRGEWSAAQGGSVTGRDGQTNGAFDSTSAVRNITLLTAAATCFLHIAVRINNSAVLGSANGPPIQFLRAGTVELVLCFNASGFIEVRRTSVAGTLLGTSSGHTALTTTAVWHHIQAKIVLGASSTGSVELRLDGTTVLTLTGVTTAGTSGSVSAVGIAGASNSSSTLLSYDDIVILDAVDATATQSRPYNDFLGDLRVAVLIPTSDGDTTAWTPSTGSNHAALVDEVPPNTTDYNGTPTATNRDLYNVGDLPSSVGTIYCVQTVLYAAKTDAGASSVKPIMKENSTVTADSSQALSTTYAAYYGTARDVRPSDGAAWTATDVNNLQAGAEAA